VRGVREIKAITSKRLRGALALSLILACLPAGCSKRDGGSGGSGESAGSAAGAGQVREVRELAVFIPGVLAGSPSYEMLAAGVRRAAREAGGVKVTVIEAGYNQAEWETKLTAIAAQGKYDLIISSNPSLPALAASVSRKFPDARFMILDGNLAGNPAIFTLSYNKHEEAYTLGYLAALLTEEAGLSPVKIGLIAAQRYPVMDEIIRKAYLEGANDALRDGGGGSAELDFRITGSWNDAGKARELAASIYKGQVKVILTISGAADEGVVQAAAENGGKVLRFDVNAYEERPGIIAGCAVMEQEKAAYSKTRLFLEGKLPFGSTESAGIAEACIDFADKDPLYIENTSAEVRGRQEAMLKRLRNPAAAGNR